MSTPPLGEPPAAVCEYWPVVASPPVTNTCASCAALRCVERRFHGTCQNHVVVDEFNRDFRIGNEPLQIVFQSRDIAFDRKVEAGNLFAVRAEHEDVRFTDLLAEKIYPARGAGYGVGHTGIGDQNVVGIARKVDDDRLVQPELDSLDVGRRCGLRAAVCRFSVRCPSSRL